MKQFTTIKVGYSAGIYGCSGEYFTTVYVNGTKHGSFSFAGLYGTEERVSRAMQEKGYTEFYTPSRYGRMVRSDGTNAFMSEDEALKYIKRGFRGDDQ